MRLLPPPKGSGFPSQNYIMNRNVIKMLGEKQEAARYERWKRQRKEKAGTLQFDIKGRKIRRRLQRTVRILALTAGALTGLILIVYIPPLLHKKDSLIEETVIAADASALRISTRYCKDNPDLDFDEDGMPNYLEEQYGSSLFWEDTDYDGISDYAEVFLTKTSPVTKDVTLISEMVSEDRKRGDTIGTPYKIDDIIFWPDDYEVKAKGGVVRTLSGFRFCFYKGWIRFPEKVFAYAYEDGVHTPLLHKEEEEAWYIDGDYEVKCYLEKLSFVNELTLPFAGKVYLDDSQIPQILSKVLPDNGGILTCRRIAEIDIDKGSQENVINPVVKPFFDESDTSRFGKDQNALKDYSYVIRCLDKGRCVALSLYSSNVGEAEGIIYGYTSDGDLLVADPESLKPAGKIRITEYAMRMMGKDGEIGQHTWFEWSGLGFDSLKYGDRINFLSSADS